MPKYVCVSAVVHEADFSLFIAGLGSAVGVIYLCDWNSAAEL